jgi:ABC-2 type transport system ATP-binding protein
MDAVRITNVTKTFGDLAAVDDLSLTVPEGAVYGFIGPNGSGKTTTLRMIVRIIYPDRGSIEVNGNIGYLPEERGIHRKMTVHRLLTFHAELRGAHKPGPEIDAWLERMNLLQFASQKVETLSKGMSQKVQFIAAVVPEPKLLILDEPFSGLDPVSADTIRASILEMRRRGSTVILSTHDMNVAENFCDNIFMIYRGKKVLDGTLDSIQSHYGSDTIRVEVEGGVRHLDKLPRIESIRDIGQVQELRMAEGCDPQDVLRALLSRTSVSTFSIVRPSLHDIFMRIAGAPDVPQGDAETEEAARA